MQRPWILVNSRAWWWYLRDLEVVGIEAKRVGAMEIEIWELIELVDVGQGQLRGGDVMSHRWGADINEAEWSCGW